MDGKSYQMKEKSNGKLKYAIPILCMFLILASYASYSLGYKNGYFDGNLTGYASGYNDGYTDVVVDGAGAGYNIRNPTYQETLNFIASDKTDENEYSKNYTCFHFTRDVKSHAFDAGYLCGFVYIEFRDGAHAIVCFNTTDHGIIFIEPQDDEIVTLIIGQPYWNRTKYSPPDYDDTVVSFTIIW
ncbi:MAG: hypothetical protein QW468_04890 [Candidatus Bathyarchaeia archaeon]